MLETQVKQDSPNPSRPRAARRRAVARRAGSRGTVTIFVAVWFLVIAGLAAVGIDGGYWYLMRRQAQNAADMAAVAGVESIIQSENYNAQTPPPTYPRTQSQIDYIAQTAAAKVATANGFTDDQNNADVYINVPPTSGSFAYAPNTVEAIVKTRAPLILTSLVRAISSMTGQTIGTRAIASLLTRPGNACLLSLHYDLTFTGSDLTAANKCIFASNATDPTAINAGNAGGNISVSAYSLLSSGGCYRCSPDYGVTTIQPQAIYQPPTPDPFAVLNTLDFTPLETSSNAGTYDNKTNTYTPGYFSNGIGISGQSSDFTFQPGLYILGGKGLQISSGNTVSCPPAGSPSGTPGCTFVILNGGSLNINGAIVQFTAANGISNYTASSPPLGDAPTAYDFSLLDGMLFYQQAPSKITGNSSNDTINGNTGSYYSGGIYMPGGNLTFNGAEGTTTSGYPNPIDICTEIVASQITMSGNGTTNVDNQSCFGTAGQSPPPQTVALVE